jgi:uncharacterized membrane protein YkgB
MRYNTYNAANMIGIAIWLTFVGVLAVKISPWFTLLVLLGNFKLNVDK